MTIENIVDTEEQVIKLIQEADSQKQDEETQDDQQKKGKGKQAAKKDKGLSLK